MKLTPVCALLALFTLNGCGLGVATGGNAFVSGLIYTQYRSPGQVGTAQALKSGESCASSILGAVATGDASLQAAKKAAGITQIAYVDHEQFSVLGVYAATCTIIYGQ